MARRKLLALVAATAAASAFAFPGTAWAPGTIVIFGAPTGSTLHLTVSGDDIVADGYLAPGRHIGCQVTRPRLRAVCDLQGVTSAELVMGPSGDMVEVLEKLPVPLTIRLGAGSDKVIANGERDTCYPGAARRNRCTLGAGNDVCITGNRNSDCVGGPGRDYCRHGNGSDGCWGGPGADVCVMGPGQDGCHGNAGNDRLFGGRNPDRLYGGPGLDYCDGGRGVGRSHTCERGPGR
jgi:Ca2+-binding RTX toxin-like protein